MNQSDIIEKIEFIQKFKTETVNLETKSANIDFPKKCYDTISSFSNKHGGTIIFGIDEDNDFEVTGVYDINDLQKRISALCSDAMEPVVRPEFFAIEYNNNKILVVEIQEMLPNQKPCYYKPKGLIKGSYTRVGDRDEVMTNYEIYALQSYKEGIREDIRPNKRATVEDLNREELDLFLKKIKEEKPNFSKNSENKILKLCGITDNNDGNIYPTLAGTMVFGDNPQAYYPQLFVACAVIPGTVLGDVGEVGQRFDDNKRIEGTIEQMLEETLVFLRKNMKTKVIIDAKTGKREDIPEYPMLALREAIANALIHRDYSIQTENAFIEVYMYDDRIVIQNPGALYGMNKIDKLGTDTIMESRNSMLIRILESKGSVIENRHSGIPTMRIEMRKMNLPEPEFIEERGSFKVIFRNSNTNNNQVSDQVSDYVSDQVSDQVRDQAKNKTLNSLDLHKQKVKEFCVEPKSAKEINEYLGISSRSYVRINIIKPLIEEGSLEYTNPNNITASNQRYITRKYIK